MQLLNTNILFKPFPSDSITEGGLEVPDSYKRISNKGTVILTGNAVKDIKSGDIVFRCKDWGDAMIFKGELVFCIDEKAILAKL